MFDIKAHNANELLKALSNRWGENDKTRTNPVVEGKNQKMKIAYVRQLEKAAIMSRIGAVITTLSSIGAFSRGKTLHTIMGCFLAMITIGLIAFMIWGIRKSIKVKAEVGYTIWDHYQKDLTTLFKLFGYEENPYKFLDIGSLQKHVHDTLYNVGHQVAAKQKAGFLVDAANEKKVFIEMFDVANKFNFDIGNYTFYLRVE
jgi:hypothetical protein